MYRKEANALVSEAKEVILHSQLRKAKAIYIAGQITGLHIEIAKQKFLAAFIFLQTETSFKKAIINPMYLTHNHDKTWESYMKESIGAMMFCDTLYMLDNWKQSKGAKIEHALAKKLKMNIIYQ